MVEAVTVRSPATHRDKSVDSKELDI